MAEFARFQPSVLTTNIFGSHPKPCGLRVNAPRIAKVRTRQNSARQFDSVSATHRRRKGSRYDLFASSFRLSDPRQHRLHVFPRFRTLFVVERLPVPADLFVVGAHFRGVTVQEFSGLGVQGSSPITFGGERSVP